MTTSHPAQPNRRVAPFVALGAATLAAAGVALAVRRWGSEQHVPLAPALAPPLHSFVSARAGRIAYYADDRPPGRPLVLVHSINAAASAFEMRPLFDALHGMRPVYALDLPGFGFSERSPRRYSPELCAAAIADFLAQVVGQPADIVALSLGSELAARAALDVPHFVASLAFISPSGFNRSSGAVQSLVGSRTAGSAVHGLLALPFVGQVLFNSIASRPSITHYMEDLFVGPPPAKLIDYAYDAAHQPGARHAPLYFLSGLLFTPQARAELYSRLAAPVLVLYDRDPFVNFDELPDFVADRPHWRAVRIAPSCGLLQWERPAETVAALERFWQRAVQTGAQASAGW